jgi:hypothetical protein
VSKTPPTAGIATSAADSLAPAHFKSFGEFFKADGFSCAIASHRPGPPVWALRGPIGDIWFRSDDGYLFSSIMENPGTEHPSPVVGWRVTRRTRPGVAEKGAIAIMDNVVRKQFGDEWLPQVLDDDRVEVLVDKAIERVEKLLVEGQPANLREALVSALCETRDEHATFRFVVEIRARSLGVAEAMLEELPLERSHYAYLWWVPGTTPPDSPLS